MQSSGIRKLAGIASTTRELQAELSTVALQVLARVNESSRATDLAIALSPTRLVIIRCVEGACSDDPTSLATMIAEGDFIWGAVVYQQGEAKHALGLVESFHVSQLHHLVARLIELQEACGESG